MNQYFGGQLALAICVSVGLLLLGCQERASEVVGADNKKVSPQAVAGQTEEKLATRMLALGFSDVGSLAGPFGEVRFEVRQIRPLEPVGVVKYGIFALLSSRLPDRTSTLFIPYEDIDLFIHGIERLQKIDHTITPFDNFQVDLSNGGGFKVGIYNTRKGDIVASVAITTGLGASIQINYSDLPRLSGLFAAAKAKLDAGKAASK